MMAAETNSTVGLNEIEVWVEWVYPAAQALLLDLELNSPAFQDSEPDPDPLPLPLPLHLVAERRSSAPSFLLNF
jgi:hypothetical protein